jgi:hypothetical protein
MEIPGSMPMVVAAAPMPMTSRSAQMPGHELVVVHSTSPGTSVAPSSPQVIPTAFVTPAANEPALHANAAPPMPAVVQKMLQQRIEVACAGVARDVEVISQSSNSLQVSFKVRNAAQGQQLAQKVLNLPELGPYRVKLEVKLGG